MEQSQQELLHRRLNSYGHTQPKALIGARPRKPAQLEPLAGSPTLVHSPNQMSPTLRRRPADVTLSPTSLRDPANVDHRSSKQVLAAGADLLSTSAPMPYSKMVRQQSAPNISDPQLEAESNGVAPSDGGANGSTGDERRDPFWFIRMLRTELSDHEFAYMNVADTEGTTWDPYNLKIVAFNEVDPNNHYTISEAGVTHCARKGKVEVAEFTPLRQWEAECGLFHEVMEIPFFKRYQSWKAYTSWRRAIQTDKVSACSTVLTNHLFILNSTFQPSLLKVRKLCVELSQLKLHQVRSRSPTRTSRPAALLGSSPTPVPPLVLTAPAPPLVSRRSAWAPRTRSTPLCRHRPSTRC